MTGYGSATVNADDRAITVEARSVNSRGLKVVVKGPPGIETLEPDLRAVVERGARRGRVDLFIRFDARADARADAPASRVLDEERVRDYVAGAKRLRDEFGVSAELDLATLARLGGVFKDRARDVDPTSLANAAVEATATATDGMVEMRRREGDRLESDLRERLSALDAGLTASEEIAPERLQRERARIMAAVAEVAEKGFDEDRMAREIAMIADRWDVGEELVRARSHLAAFGEYLDLSSDEPVGKRLGFLVQELQREVNTLGAKANDTRITTHVVEMKNEIEKLREQVENVE
jgi:uncharacterized protein (TIGR00255 family)